MDALALYASDSSSSEDDDDEETTNAAQLATTIPILTEEQARESQIFQRNVAHTVGHWAGHIYLELDQEETNDDSSSGEDDEKEAEPSGSNALKLVRERWIHRLRDNLQVKGLPVKALVLHDHWHVSLSKTFYLQHYNIESFVKSLQEALSSSSYSRRHLTTVRVHGDQPLVLTNANDLPSERQAQECRTFWCCQVHPPLPDLVAIVDKVLSVWRLPPFYDPPIFHTSWASAPGDWSSSHRGAAAAAGAATTSTPLAVRSSDCFLFTVRHVTCRIADKVYRLPLSTTTGA